jgi:hypothetical protein
LDVATATGVTPVSASVVGGAGDELWRWWSGRRAVAASTCEDEVGAAATVYPEAAVIDAPGLAANAGGAADLTDELRVTCAADGAPIPFAIVGGAGDGLLGWAVATVEGEVGAAAAVYPETPVVDAPGLAANAGRAADLADELSVACAADGAPVSFAVVGGASNALLAAVAGLCGCVLRKRESGCEKDGHCRKKIGGARHLASFQFKSVDGAGPDEECLLSRIRINRRRLPVESAQDAKEDGRLAEETAIRCG